MECETSSIFFWCLTCAQGKAECFGSAYTFSIKNTVTEGEDEADGSFEYLVFTKPLVQIGAKYGLKLVILAYLETNSLAQVTKYEDPSLDSLFDRVGTLLSQLS